MNGSYFVYGEDVTPHNQRQLRLRNGKVLGGGYLAAYSKTFEDALVWAELTARRINGTIWTHNREGRLVKVTGGPAAYKKYHNKPTRRAA